MLATTTRCVDFGNLALGGQLSGMTEPSTNIFRQRAINRLSSPEQLDRILVVARARDWVGLGTLGVLIAIALGWSVLGSVPTRVLGQGLFVSQGGQVFTAVSPSAGTIKRITAVEGQVVRIGDVLAEIDQPGLQQELHNAQAAAAEALAQLDTQQGQIHSNAAARQRNSSAQRQTTTENRVDALARSDAATQQLRDGETLLAKGFITKHQVAEMRQAVAEARQAVSEAGSRLVEIDGGQINGLNSDNRELHSAALQLAQAKRAVDDIVLQLVLRSKVLSPTNGRVTEIRTPVGTSVAIGTQIISVESGHGGLQLILYLSPDQGKAVLPGMTVRVSPSVVKKEEFGTIKGVVREVSDFPSSPEAMHAVLQNDELVTRFSSAGSPFVARIDLIRDPATATGYAWTGGRGPKTRLTTGTPATAEVTTSKQSPISFVLPFLRGASGI